MTRDQLIKFLNHQVDTLGLKVLGLISVDSAARMTFDDLTSDSLEALQLIMALEEATGADVELDHLRKCATLLDAIDLILEAQCRR
jgi:acyl carrier protein